MAALRQRLKRLEAAQRETPRGNAIESTEPPPPGRADAAATKGRDRVAGADQDRLTHQLPHAAYLPAAAAGGSSAPLSARGSSAADEARRVQRVEARAVKDRAREEALVASAAVDEFESRIKRIELERKHSP